uniref:Growth hormone secretagogue receptor type 1 n=2 Tax=Sus scrofa TaxID=9823 RepID=A0A8D0VKD4_PIG
MAVMQTPGGPSPGQTCVLILIFTVLLQALCVALTYVYFTNELKQMQDKYSKSGIACFLKEDDSFWDPTDDERMLSPCWQVKWQLRQFVRKMILRTYEETISTVSEKQQGIPHLEREKGPQRVAAHITGTSRKRSTFPSLSSKYEKALGQKINSWESSRYKTPRFMKWIHSRDCKRIFILKRDSSQPSFKAVVVFAFILCWLPFHVGRYLFSKSLEPGSVEIAQISQYCNLVSFVLFYLSAAINPILYNIMSKKYRVAVFKLLGFEPFSQRKLSTLKDESSRAWTESSINT